MTRAGVILVCFLPGLAQAQAATKEVAAIERCRGIQGSNERLACYDEASARLIEAVRTKELTVLDKDGVRATKRSLFGFTTPDSGIFARADEPEFSQIDSTIAQVSAAGHDMYTITTAEGALWRTVEPLAFAPRTGAPIQIRKGALGSYIIKVGSLRGVKGLRLR